MILILGTQDDLHSRHIHDVLQKRGVETEYLVTSKIPTETLMTYSPNNIKECGYLVINGKKVYFKDVQGVYWRISYGASQAKISAGADSQFLTNKVIYERKCALDSMLDILDDNCNMVNSAAAVRMHQTKAYQLSVMAKNNIRVPKTLITNDVDALREFYEANNKNVIFKPVYSGAHTKKLTEEHFAKDYLDALKTSPIQLQECIDGVDIRIFALNGQIFPAEIKAETLDFRGDDKRTAFPVEVPDYIKDNCMSILNLFHLKYSGIDIKKTKDNEYVFIEANPAAMFIAFEKWTKYPVEENLIQLLLK